MDTISYDQFSAVEFRTGTITKVEDFPEARKPAYKLTIDFGKEIGTKRSSAQITHYDKESLVGRQIVAVVNFEPKQIGPFISECLVCGVESEDGRVILLGCEEEVPKGRKVF